jgi:serine/threonine protein kinase
MKDFYKESSYINLSSPRLVTAERAISARLGMTPFYQNGEVFGIYSYTLVPFQKHGTVFDLCNSLITYQSRLQASTALYLSLEMCRLLEYLRSVGLSHNDLKLENIVIRDDFSLALIDFAHCSLYGEVLQTGSLGTVIYRAPEMNIPAKYQMTFKTDKADIFALAGCLFVLNFLRLPFGGENDLGATYTNKYYKFF